MALVDKGNNLVIVKSLYVQCDNMFQSSADHLQVYKSGLMLNATQVKVNQVKVRE